MRACADETFTMQLCSPDFAPQSEIPRRYGREGDNVAPALCWTGVPEHAKSLVLIVDDPDAADPQAPEQPWVHWMIYDIPPRAFGLPEGAREGLNDWHLPGWGGPCPPAGRHRCVFRLYALDATLPQLPPHAGKDLLEAQMRGHVLAHAELIGTYRRQ
jgi:hypothetical protein